MSVLSDQCICALEAAITAACIEAADSSTPLNLWSHVLGIVHPTIQANARKQALRYSTMLRLPDELLVETFAHLPLWDRVRVATVCHRWRTVSLDAVAALWSDIPHLRNVDTYAVLLARAGDHPVTLEYAPDNLESVSAFCALLSRNIHRLRGLRLVLPASTGNDDFFAAASCFSDSLDYDAPILASLFISDPEGIFLNTDPSPPLVGNPALRTIELHSLRLSRLEVCAGSSALRTLKISTPGGYNTLSSADLRILASFSALEYLALNLRWVDDVDLSAHDSRLPRSLQHLHLELSGACFDKLVALDDFARFQTLHIAILDDPPDFQRIASRMPFVAAGTVSASVHGFLETCSLMVMDARGRRRVLENLVTDAHWHALLHNVTRLRIDLYPNHLGAPEGAVVLPALQELVLDVTTATAFSYVPEWPLLECPHLQDVRVVSEFDRPALACGKVLNYLQRLLGSQSRLKALVLDGVELAPEPGIDLEAALQAVAEHVSEVHSETLSPDSYRVWSDSCGKLADF